MRGSPRDYRDAHPARPVLVVEVADTTLYMDTRLKVGLYARAGITDYWVLNLVDRVLMVYREPTASPDDPYRWKYRRVESFGADAFLSPLAAASAGIAVADLFP